MGVPEAFIIWRGRLSLFMHKFRVTFGWVSFDIMEMLGHDVFDICQYSTIGFQERRIQYAPDGKSVVIRVVQHRHGGICLRLSWDLGIEGFIYDRMVQGFRVT